MAGVLVVGLARSGVGAARLLAAMGRAVTVTDMRSAEQLSAQLAELPKGVRLMLGAHPIEAFTQAELIVVSPGVPMSLAPIAQARANGVPVIGELELAYRAMPDVPYYAITGTNGKSTTTTLLHLMLGGSLMAGNIGSALSEELLRVDAKQIKSIVVELSSFQLEAVESFRAHGAAMLNVTPDHLDRYESLEHYGRTKFNVFNNQGGQDFAVLNADDAMTMRLYNDEFKARMRGSVSFFSRRGEVRGVYAREGSVMFDFGGRRGTLMPASDIAIRGVHNLENAMAAASMALGAGVEPQAIANVLRTFKGLEHRMEFVRELDGVRYINDSKGTNVDAAIKSVDGFDEPVVLIAGGRDKAGDFGAFASAIGRKLKALVLIGEAAGKLRKAFDGVTRCTDAATLKDAIDAARAMAQSGDVVLLSPACASFDMFKDYEDRGRQFKRMVGELW